MRSWLRAKIISCEEAIKYYRDRIRQAHKHGSQERIKRYLEILQKCIDEKKRYEEWLKRMGDV